MTQTYKVQVSMNQAHIVESGFVWKQGDFGFNIEIEVLDFDTTGATPQIIFRKSTGAVEATTITRDGNKFTYAIRGTELDTPGPCVCDLKLKDSTTKRVSTASFKYFVIPDTMDGLNQQASSYSDTIEQIVGGFDDDINDLRQADNAEKQVRTKEISNLSNLIDTSSASVLNAYINGEGVIKAQADRRLYYVPCLPSHTYTIDNTSTYLRLGWSTSIPTVDSTVNNLNADLNTHKVYTTGSTAAYLLISIKEEDLFSLYDGNYYSAKDIDARDNITALTGDLDTEKVVRKKEITNISNLIDTSSASVINAYINGEGIVKAQDNRRLYYVPCLPSHTYTVNNTSTYLRLGWSTSVPQAEDTINNPNVDAYDHKVYTTGNAAAYLLISIKDDDSFSLYDGSYSTAKDIDARDTIISTINELNNEKTDRIKELSSISNLIGDIFTAPAINAYINGEGIVKAQDNRRLYYVPCLPSHTYTVNNTSTYLRLGWSTSVPQAEDTISNPNVDAYDHKVYTTGSTATYLLISIKDDDVFSLYDGDNSTAIDREARKGYNNAFNKLLSSTRLTSEAGYYITSGATVDTTSLIPSSTYCNIIDECSEGDIYTVYGTGSTDALLWAFIDDSDNVLNASPEDLTANGAILTAPSDAIKVIIQGENDLIAYKGRVKDIQNYPIKLINGNITSTNVPPTFTTAFESITLRLERYTPIKKGQTIEIDSKTLKHRVFMWSGDYGNTCERVLATEYTAGKGLYTATQDGFFIIVIRNEDSTDITPSDFTGSIKINNPTKTLRVITYNTGDYVGDGYTKGSEELLIQYRKAIGEANANIALIPSDTYYVDDEETKTAKEYVFALYKYFYDNYGTVLYNHKMLGGDYPITNIERVYYTTPNVAHAFFLVGHVIIDDIDLLIVCIHFDWQDVTRRHSQVQECINYCNNYEYVIVGGDFNPSTRVNGTFPEGSSHYHNYYNPDDYEMWKTAGYRCANDGYWGKFQTDISYSDADDGGASAAWDNIIVSPNITIKNAGTIRKQYMNDHALVYADIQL